jgi:Acetyltransferase (GNAT) domain
MSSSATQARKELHVDTLSKDQLPLWDSLVDKSPHGTVFHKTWWLQAAGCDFEILGCWNQQGELSAGIPLPRKKRGGLTLCHSPALTPYLGPVFDLAEADSARDKLYLMRSRGESLARAVHPFDSFCQIAGTEAPDFQGFLWAGFHVEIGYTFRFGAGTTPEQVFRDAARTHRQRLNPKRNEGISIECGSDVSALLELNRSTFSRQGRSAPYSESLVRDLFDAAAAHDCGVVYVARGPRGRPLSSIFVVRDSRASYQIVSGIDWNEHNMDAGYLATWQAIRDALDSGRAFDFEGSRIRGVEQYYRRWGAPAMPTWTLRKVGTWRGRVATALLNGVNGKN